MLSWHGTDAEKDAFQAAVIHNCECVMGAMGMRTFTCVLHKAMLEDQAWLDRMLFVHRMRQRFIDEEERDRKND